MVEGEAGDCEMMDGLGPHYKTDILYLFWENRQSIILCIKVCKYITSKTLPLLQKKKYISHYFHELKRVKHVQDKLSDGLCKAGRHNLSPSR